MCVALLAVRNTLHPTHRVKVTHTIDTIALIVGVIQPLATIPQIYLVYTSHDAAQVSLFTWTGYDIGSVIFLIYGIRHKLAPVIWAQIFWLIVQTAMMIAVFVF